MKTDAYSTGGTAQIELSGADAGNYGAETCVPLKSFIQRHNGASGHGLIGALPRRTVRLIPSAIEKTCAGTLAPVVEMEFFPRVLASILYADVAGYCRLTEDDEEGTHRRLRASLDLLGRGIERHKGTVAHFAGDAVLARFTNLNDALSCAVGVQAELAQRNRLLPEDRKVQFRMGVNVGDVIVDRFDVFGEVVNVTVRLQSVAEPGGICVSEAVVMLSSAPWLTQFKSLGEHHFKNIRRPVRAYGLSAVAANRLLR